MESLISRLDGTDKHDKHLAWVQLEQKLDSGEVSPEELLNVFLCFRNHGTRYRAWNKVYQLIQEKKVSQEVVKRSVNCLLELLSSDDINVRWLTWYITLPPLIGIILSEEELVPYYNYLCELKDYLDLLDDIPFVKCHGDLK
ncbi:hypothetical protein HS7_10440 [Sulfolobales archaeon HS-7]|nr:hypothetical protein HS7_10440 [Sulfolobales archaeon HS-7]